MGNLLRRLFGGESKQKQSASSASPGASPAVRQQQEPVIVVSGLPRSGTSMMMKMLDAAGVNPVIDEIRAADVDNPKGYYEFERVKQMDKGDVAWLADAPGKSVKVISALLRFLPADYEYRVIFMRRAMPEILASQRKMLKHREEFNDASKQEDVSDEEIAALFDAHLKQVFDWVKTQPNIRLLEIDYNAMLVDPEPYAQQIAAFLPWSLDAQTMAEVVDPDLYRNRAQ
ncbi:MAG: sulfotransferase domain-containing protein [Caldilineaceae bacterium]|nr:sulfotransferase domain-containing protein [Caldilineaceae bacterium]